LLQKAVPNFGGTFDAEAQESPGLHTTSDEIGSSFGVSIGPVIKNVLFIYIYLRALKLELQF